MVCNWIASRDSLPASAYHHVEVVRFSRNNTRVPDEEVATGHQADPGGRHHGSSGLQLRPLLPVGLRNEWTLGQPEELDPLRTPLAGLLGVLGRQMPSIFIV